MSSQAATYAVVLQYLRIWPGDAEVHRRQLSEKWHLAALFGDFAMRNHRKSPKSGGTPLLLCFLTEPSVSVIRPGMKVEPAMTPSQ